MACNLELWSKLNPFFLQVTFYQGIVSQQQKQCADSEQTQEEAPALVYFKYFQALHLMPGRRPDSSSISPIALLLIKHVFKKATGI